MKSSVHSEEDDFVPELHRNVHPRERPDWEETLSTMARGADVPEIPGDLGLKTCGSTASMKVKQVKKLPFTKGHFPKMAECAHFHYENVEFGSIQLSLSEEQNEVTKNGCESKELVYLVHIACQGKSWIVKRSYEDFRVLDKHLHLCIYDRRFSQLSELPRSDALKDSPESITQMLMAYLSRLSAIAGNKINCGPALTWMEIDNKGNHLLVHEESSINTPAVGAAHVIKRYTARAPDELTLEVGDIVSVIDMPPKVLSTWWRGKHGFQVGLFPGHCVELINQKVPQSVTNSVPKPDEFQKLGIQCFYHNPYLVNWANLIFLCCLPSQLPTICLEIQARLEKGCIVYSFAAAIPIARLKLLLNHTNILRPQYQCVEDFVNIWGANKEITAALQDPATLQATCPYSSAGGIILNIKWLEGVFYAILNICTAKDMPHLQVLQHLNELFLSVHFEDCEKDGASCPKFQLGDFVNQVYTKNLSQKRPFPWFDLTAVQLKETPFSQQLSTSTALQDHLTLLYCDSFGISLTKKQQPVVSRGSPSQ